MRYVGFIMRIVDLLRFTTSSIRAYPLRSGLTMLGIAIGILSVVLLTSLGQGVQAYVLKTFSQFGTRIIAINPGRTQTGGSGAMLASTRPLTLDDALSLERLPGIETVVPTVQGTGPIEYANRVRSTDILGVNYQMPATWQFEIAQGQFLPNPRGSYPQSFAVLGDKVWRELFNRQEALGKFIRVGGERYRIIGILSPKGQMLGFDLDDIVYIDAERALTLFNRPGLMEIDLTYSAAFNSEQISAMVRDHLINRHNNEDFSLMTQDQMMSTLGRILDILKMSVAGLGTISLIVGSIGILTIMVTAVHERRTEIGLIRALGGSSRTISLIFLSESILLSVFGGLIGLCVALAIMGTLKFFLPAFPIQLSPIYLLLAVIIALATGLLSGLLPARQAAALNPIEALQAD